MPLVPVLAGGARGVVNIPEISLVPGTPGKDGKNGLDGKNGKDGGQGVPGADGISGVLLILAVDTLAPFSVVTINGKIADSSNLAYFNKVVGVNGSTQINSGFTGNVNVAGLVTNSGWSWSPGASIFLNGTNLSQTPASTGFSQVIAVAKTSDTIFVSLSDPILL